MISKRATIALGIATTIVGAVVVIAATTTTDCAQGHWETKRVEDVQLIPIDSQLYPIPMPARNEVVYICDEFAKR